MSRLEQLAAHRGWKQVLLTGLLFLLLAARVPLTWRTGEFVAEDGWVFFAAAWNRPFWPTLLLPYAGYFHLLPRLLAALCIHLPVLAQPCAYAVIGLGLNAVILGAFYLPVFRTLLPSDPGRLTVGLLLALAPNAQNLGLLLGLHWYLAYALVLIILAPFPARPAGRVGVGLIILLCAWSSPSALVLIPFALARWWRQPAERFKLGLVLGALGVVAGLVLLSRLGHPERTGEFRWTDVPGALDRLVLRGWLGVGLLGPRLAGMLGAEFPGVISLAGLSAAVWLTLTLWRHRARDFARPAALVLGAGLLMLLLSLTRTAYVAELATLTLPVHTRYLTAPTLLLYLGLGIIGAHTLGRATLGLGTAALGGLLLLSLGAQNHWARPAVWFHLRDALPAIRQLEAQAGPASLYIPSDVPYWGPVLEKDGGVTVPPSAGLAKAIGAKAEADGKYSSWLGRFTPAAGAWVRHETRGRLEFTGVERGRVFFRDPAGRLLFTSPLLYPKFWRLAGAEWTLLGAAPGE